MAAAGTGIEVKDGASLYQLRKIANGPGADPTITSDAFTTSDFVTHSGVSVTGGIFHSSGGSVPNVTVDGGSFQVADGGATVTSSGGVNIRGGFIGIHVGETLTVTDGVRMSRGQLITWDDANVAVKRATIDGTFTMTGGTVLLTTPQPQPQGPPTPLGPYEISVGPAPPPGTPPQPPSPVVVPPAIYSSLQVTKAVSLLGGIFSTKLDPVNALNRDWITTEDTITTRVCFTIQPLGNASILPTAVWVVALQQ